MAADKEIFVNKFIKTAAAAGGAVLLAKGLDNRLEVTHYYVKSPKIPREFNGFKIVQISDLHSDNPPCLTAEIRHEAPDIIVSTGDLVHHRGSYMRMTELCGRLVKIAPVYAVSGNHDLWRGDYGEFENALSEAGVKTLNSEHIVLEKGGDKISLYGIADPFAVTTENIKKFMDREYARLPESDGYKILLFHRANWLDYFKDKPFDLIISGHMHGGQVRIPMLGGFISPRSSWSDKKRILFPKYFGGRYDEYGRVMIVSRGLGNPMPIPRVFNRPELVVITLEHTE